MYVTISDDFSELCEPVLATSKTRRPVPVSCKPGGYLFREGDEATRIYQVVSGVLRLTRVMENGRRQVIAFGYPGDVVGFPKDGLHHTDCDALTPVRVVSHGRDALEKGEGDPTLHHQLLQAALREISGMQDHFMMLGRKSAPEKVASFLAVLAARVGQDCDGNTQIALPMSRADIADFLGLTTETVSRTITRLRKAGIIALPDPQTVHLRDPEALSDLADGT